MAKGDIRLHPKLGLNPHMAVCPQCNGDNGELLLIGNNTRIYRCEKCGLTHYGKAKKDVCPKCKGWLVFQRHLGESEKLPGSLCEKCVKTNEELKAAVRAGGVYWRCVDCKAAGAIKAASEFAKAVREKHGIQAPGECGVEFTKKDCPACRP